ncbi:MAG: signal peptidase I [Clostridiales bacterium]|nr:signal peptidase I [Clostridiales bacterium]
MPVFLFTSSFVFKIIIVDGKSMVPTLDSGERLIVSNLGYTPKQKDIIIFNNENKIFTKTLVKRIIATEGQTVNIDFNNGIVYVDGKAIAEDYINDLTHLQQDFVGEVTVPKDHVFVMGDNRNESKDSRNSEVGFVPVKSIIGKAILRIYPFKFFK